MQAEAPWTTIPALDPTVAAALLGPPRLPAAAVAQVPLARRAGTMAAPVLLAAPASGGRLLLARALHALGGRGGPLIAPVGCLAALDDLPPGTTLYVPLAALEPAAVPRLEAILDDAEVWVLAGVEPDTVLPPPLVYRLAPVVLAVPALRDRTPELAALAAHILARLAQRRGTPPPELRPAALERLIGHDWPGDLAELEAVLARALLVAEGDVIDAEHLALGAGAAPARAPAAASAPAPAPAAELEFLLAELAHELRNPMVTIKTFASHLPALLEDAELRARFDTLTGEAIARMDNLLENVLAFARLPAPTSEPVEIAPILAHVLEELRPELAGRAVRVRQVAAPGARYAADPQHLAYALRNLFMGVVREVPAREELQVEAAANGVVTLRFTAGEAAAERLRRLAAPGDDAADTPTLGDPTLLPLAFRLARAVLARNHGALGIVPEGSGATTLVIRLPPAGPEEHPG